jgi:DNA polymerase-1
MEIDRKRFLSILSQIKTDNENAPAFKEQVLLVDGNNLLMRSYCAVPTLNDDGEHVGAIIGSLKSLGAAIKILHPTQVILVFDGKGGSKKRRELFPEYKAKRATRIRVNRIYTDIVTPDHEDESIRKQLSRVIQYFDCCPVKIMAMENIEADDTIAYISQQILKDTKITIMSTDKDYLQLADDRVQIWSPTKGKLYGPREVKEEYGFSSCNFIMYRIMDGDKSDCIPGINGAGAKTILKNFPALATETPVSIDDLLNFATLNISNGTKFYGKILDGKATLELNYKLMQLKEVDISSSTKLKILDIINSPINHLNKLEFIKLMVADKVNGAIPNYNVWLSECFALLEMNAKTFNKALEDKKI